MHMVTERGGLTQKMPLRISAHESHFSQDYTAELKFSLNSMVLRVSQIFFLSYDSQLREVQFMRTKDTVGRPDTVSTGRQRIICLAMHNRNLSFKRKTVLQINVRNVAII